MTTCRYKASQVSIWILCLAHSLPLNKMFILATFKLPSKVKCFKRSLPFHCSYGYILLHQNAPDSLVLAALGDLHRGICRDQTQRCLLYKMQQKWGQNKCRAKRTEASLNIGLIPPSCWSVWSYTLLSLPLIATYHAGWSFYQPYNTGEASGRDSFTVPLTLSISFSSCTALLASGLLQSQMKSWLQNTEQNRSAS